MNAAGSATDACDLNGDMICDIEPSTTQNIFCTGAMPNTCTANYSTGTTTDDMINDYMSYADDDCMNTFTLNQAQRMWATLNLQRSVLWQPENLIATGVLGNDGCIPPYLNAQINTDNAVFCTGRVIRFSNPTAGNTAISYQWQFAGGSPSSSNVNNVSVSYNQPGNYKVFLTVSNGTDIRTDSLLLSVSECQPDSSTLSMAHWYFGNFGSIDFSSGIPIQTTTALTNRSIQAELAYPSQLLPFIGSTISLSDSLGNLQFYSNGVSVWNKNHQKINTSPIFGASDINASTGFCYIPFPGHKGKYFAAGVYPNFDETPSGVRFVLVDADSNTVSPYKEFNNPSLPNRFSEFLTVVPHCNGTDYWIITKGFGLNDTKFYSFLVTSSGIDVAQLPIISSGFSHPGFGGSGNQLKSNRKGNKLLLCSPHGYLGIETGALYDFDSRTGIISNEQKIPNVTGYSNIQGGGAFSPNGKYFYLMRSTNFATNGPPYWLFQYRTDDLKYNVFYAPGFYFAASFQPGPDGQIYVTTQDNMFAKISNLDEWGAVSVNGSFINMMKLNPEIRTGVSIPSFIDAKRPEPNHPDFIFTTISCNTFRFTTLCFDNYTSSWDFGDGTPLQTGSAVDHDFNTPGVYNVSLTLLSGAVVYGSVSKKITVLPISANIAGPGFVCTNGNYPAQYFGDILPDVNYKWSIINGGSISGPDNLSYVNVIWNQNSSSGNIRLDINREGCHLNNVKPIAISAGPLFNWPLPDSVCLYDSSFVLSASPPGGSYSGKGITNNIFSPSEAGLGNHIIKYSYFDETTCLGQVEKTIKVSLCRIPTGPEIDCNTIFNSIIVAPNPVNNLLQLKSPYALKYVQVYNSAGQKIVGGQLFNNSIKLPVLATGIYTVLVFCEKNMAFKAFKFLKL